MKPLVNFRSSMSVSRILTNPERCLVENGSDNEYVRERQCLLVDILAVLEEPDQLVHTAQEISRLSDGMAKIVGLMAPAADMAVLDKYDALEFPSEIRHLTNESTDGRLEGAPPNLDSVVNFQGFRLPRVLSELNDRPDTNLGKALTRQLKAVLNALNNHDKRCVKRATAYMFGRPVVTAKQRVLGTVMREYPELNWKEDVLPYISLKERRTAGA